MLDRLARRCVDPLLEPAATILAALEVPATAITLTGFALGITGCVAISQGYFLTGLTFILLNRLADGLDGAVARQTQITDYGGFLDIVCDLIFYASVPLSFGLADRTNNLFPSCFVIHSFMGSSGSFLAAAILSAKRGVTTGWEGKKSFYYHFGLMEGTETILYLTLCCALPSYFPILSWTFGVLCWLTALLRVAMVKSLL
ncbi:MAG: CDP-alcohol phosphatidyltransferase family protein [Planctomycetota bacterium]